MPDAYALFPFVAPCFEFVAVTLRTCVRGVVNIEIRIGILPISFAFKRVFQGGEVFFIGVGGEFSA